MISPSSSSTSRRTPCVAGCDGPMLRTIFSPMSPRFSRIRASAAATRVTGSGDSISRVVKAMRRSSDYARERRLPCKCKVFAREPRSELRGCFCGAECGRLETKKPRPAERIFRRNSPARRMKRRWSLPQLRPVRPCVGKDLLRRRRIFERNQFDPALRDVRRQDRIRAQAPVHGGVAREFIQRGMPAAPQH